MTKEEEEEVGLFSFSIYHQNKDSCAIRVKQKKRDDYIKVSDAGKNSTIPKNPHAFFFFFFKRNKRNGLIISLHFSTTKEEEKINKISQHFFFFKERSCRSRR
jgi:adenosine deaminase